MRNIFYISELFIAVTILTFTDSLMYILYLYWLSTILYMLGQKCEKQRCWVDNLRQNFLHISTIFKGKSF